MYLEPLAVACAFSFLHFFGLKISEHTEQFHIELVSFGAGLLVGTFFLEIVPHIKVGEQYLGSFIYIYLLMGFVLIHVLEKFFYQRANSEIKVTRAVIRFEAGGLMAYGLFVGIIVAVFFEAYDNLAYFILAPFFVRAFIISISLKHLIEKAGSRLYTILYYVTPIIGTLLGLLLIINKIQLFFVLSITTGFIFYILVHDVIPLEKVNFPTP
ncbi:MAG: hypothetical protein NWF08_04290 [Candidatus Bathyarchaeota archaeon]|nr:hypothetical protein [Candidatus Bathyarchaeota archaeon]